MRVFALVLLVMTGLASTGCSSAGDELGASSDELSSTEVVQKGDTLRVTATSLHLRKDPSMSARILRDLGQGELVTCSETSGEDGWVHVTDQDGVVGYAFGKYLARTGGTSPTPAPGPVATGGSCDPSRAVGAVNRYEKALHDAIAYAEGTRNEGKDGYNVLFSNRKISSCARHPNQCIAFGSSCSTAAGRYQFLTTTWNSVKAARGLSSFEPENQELGAAYLVGNVRRVTIPSGRALTASEFSNAMGKLSYEWASLPPGRYGQPSKTMSQVRAVYCNVAGC